MEHPTPAERTSLTERASAAAMRLVLSPRLALALLATLLVFALLGGVLPRAVPEGISRMESSRRPPLSWTSPEVFGSRPFRILLAIVAATAFLRALQILVPSWNSSPPTWGLISHEVRLPYDVGDAWAKVSQAFSTVGQDLIGPIESRGVRYFCVRQIGIKRWFPGVFYVGVLVFLFASVVRWRCGWVGPRIDLALGETRPLGGRAGLEARLDQVEIVPRKDGTIDKFNSRIALLREGEEKATLALRLDSRAVYAGVSIYQLGFGPAVRLSARGADGEALWLHRMLGDTTRARTLRVRFTDEQQERLLAAPDVGLIIRLVQYPSLPAQGIQGRALHVQILRGRDGQVLDERLLTETGHITANGVTVDAAFEYYAVLRAESEPELLVALTGGSLMLLGIAALVAWPPRGIWVAMRQEEGGTYCRLSLPRRDGEADWFQRASEALVQGSDA